MNSNIRRGVTDGHTGIDMVWTEQLLLELMCVTLDL